MTVTDEAISGVNAAAAAFSHIFSIILDTSLSISVISSFENVFFLLMQSPLFVRFINKKSLFCSFPLLSPSNQSNDSENLAYCCPLSMLIACCCSLANIQDDCLSVCSCTVDP